jgi:hypothetical protein
VGASAMTTYELLTTIAAIGGLAIGIGGFIIALVSLSRTRKLDSQQVNLQSKQVELTQLQLDQVRKQAAAVTSSASAPTADVRVSMEGFSRAYRIVISNWGDGEARDVNFDLQLQPGRVTPLVSGDYDEKIPIPVLAPGAQCSLLAAPSFDSGTVFDAKWSWRDPDGSQQHRESRLTLP